MTTQPNVTTIVTVLIVLALFIFRNTRPRRMSIAQLWIMPAILVALTAFIVWATVVQEPQLLGLSLIAGIVGIVAGVPLGYARGHHSDVRLGERPGTIVLHPSVIVMVVWLVAFALRYAIKYFLPNAGPQALALSNGFLLFAAASIITANVMIFRKYEQLRAAVPE